ncbi:MAG: PorP/SprF family type IX secretion system membrane protein [Bacteroidota bacterium]
MKKGLILGFMLLALMFRAQDIHFSMYNLSPLTLNPANTGNYNGDWRLMGNYRSQWREISKAYNTFSIGGDMNFYPFNQNVAGGIFFLNDKSGGNLSINKIFVSGAYHKKIAGFKLSLGLQPGLVIKSIDFNSHTFPNQLNWGSGNFDNSLPNNEPFTKQRLVYFDANAGFNVSKRFKKFEPEVGGSFFHLNRPNESFYSQPNKLPIRQIYVASLRYFVNAKIAVVPNMVVNVTAKANDWIFGGNLEYTLSKTSFFENKIFGGFMWRKGVQRISDAAIVNFGIKYSQYTIGFSYDVNVSPLKTSTGAKGAYEIALIYTGKNSRIHKKQIPCDRY